MSLTWSNWYSLDEDSIIKNSLPSQSGVLRRRQKGPILRRVGSSDILYIGSSKDLRRRVPEMLNPHKAKTLGAKIQRFLYEDGPIDFSFALTDFYSYKEEKGKLLKAYEAEHLELTPFNVLRN